MKKEIIIDKYFEKWFAVDGDIDDFIFFDNELSGDAIAESKNSVKCSQIVE